jgi:hypothetical protein
MNDDNLNRINEANLQQQNAIKAKKEATKNKIIKISLILFGVALMVIAVVMLWPKKKVIPTEADFEAAVFKAAQTYVEKNKDELDVDLNIDGFTFVQLQTLVDSKYLDKTLIDPSTEKAVDLTKYVKVILNEDKSLNYEITSDYLKPTSFAKYLKTLLSSNEYTMYDDMTNDHNIRYYSATPNNYIYLSVDGTNKLFRIIGVMNNVDNGTGKLETRVKVVSVDSLGIKAWDTNNSNNWTNATLKDYLNNDYLTHLNGITTDNANTLYNLGGNKTSNIYSSAMYTSEHNNNTSDTTYFMSGNPASWTGVVSLMYASDYGYAAGLNCAGTSTKKGFQVLSGYSDTCYTTNWLYANLNEWLLTPLSVNAHNSFLLQTTGNIAEDYAVTNIYNFRAVL